MNKKKWGEIKQMRYTQDKDDDNKEITNKLKVHTHAS